MWLMRRPARVRRLETGPAAAVDGPVPGRRAICAREPRRLRTSERSHDVTDRTGSPVSPAGVLERVSSLPGRSLEDRLAGDSYGTGAPAAAEHGPVLRGRRDECEVLGRLVAGVRAGHSGVLVLHGEAGTGKTALLDYLAAHAAGCRIARAAGAESETDLPFAGLHQLCAPFLDGLGRLPGPQRDALGTAFGLSAGGTPDRFLAGLAVLTLLAGAGEQQPLICLIDDAQWLDPASAQVLAFVARQLRAEPVALILAARQPPGASHLTGLPELPVQCLSDTDARALLQAAVHGPLDPAVLDRIIAETRGNPLALLELPRGLTPTQLAGGFGLPGPAEPTGRTAKTCRRLLSPLPPMTRQLLLVAAAEPVGDPVLLWRAASLLGVEAEAAGPAAAAGIIEPDGHVRFRHPLVRSAIYRAATPGERQRVHQALADATDVAIDPDRRAWHRGQATPGLDEDVAAELERSASQARARGGLPAAAAFLKRAVELTPEPGRRAQRALAAAQREHEAGAPDVALMLLSLAAAGPVKEPELAHVRRLRVQILISAHRGHDAPSLLLRAAQQLGPFHPAMARETCLDAFSAAMSASRWDHGGMHEVAMAVLAADWADPGRAPADAGSRLLSGLAILITKGHAAAAPALKQALTIFRAEASSGSMSDEDALRWLWLGCHVARVLGDDASWDELTDRRVHLARDLGAFSALPLALAERMSVDLLAGDLAAAAALLAEINAVRAAGGSHPVSYAAASMAAWRGHDAGILALDTGQLDGEQHGQGLARISAGWESAALRNGLGRYGEALAAAENQRGRGFSAWMLPELIEAAVRSGSPERAVGPLHELSEISRASGTGWALGIESRCRALLHEGEAAERLYQEAIARLSRTRVRLELARAHLLYGEWLRRERRRVDAREQLRIAHEMLIAMGADGFAQRARRELVATGETMRRQSVETRDELTRQETQIARLAADGRTNPEIGGELFLSARTVEWHLRKVYEKLGVSSRRQLRGRLAGADQPTVSA
jgi:DNA-binding CsgD family transcriptional regulator